MSGEDITRYTYGLLEALAFIVRLAYCLSLCLSISLSLSEPLSSLHPLSLSLCVYLVR